MRLSPICQMSPMTDSRLWAVSLLRRWPHPGPAFLPTGATSCPLAACELGPLSLTKGKVRSASRDTQCRAHGAEPIFAFISFRLLSLSGSLTTHATDLQTRRIPSPTSCGENAIDSLTLYLEFSSSCFLSVGQSLCCSASTKMAKHPVGHRR